MPNADVIQEQLRAPAWSSSRNIDANLHVETRAFPSPAYASSFPSMRRKPILGALKASDPFSVWGDVERMNAVVDQETEIQANS